MKTAKLRNVTLGEGRPTIAVPITGTSVDAIVEQAKEIIATATDVVVEWRIDFFEGVEDADKLVAAGQELRRVLGDVTLLTTFRTKGEGGALALDDDKYFAICDAVLTGNFTDAMDLERFHDEIAVKNAIAKSHENQVVIVMSNHDFNKTPAEEEIVSRLESMADLGADVAKIAVMPNSVDDVLTLLSATNEARKKVDVPLVTMSMGDLGKVSRMAGEVFGSALTFGTIGAASAPDQVSYDHLKNDLLDLKLD